MKRNLTSGAMSPKEYQPFRLAWETRGQDSAGLSADPIEDLPPIWNSFDEQTYFPSMLSRREDYNSHTITATLCIGRGAGRIHEPFPKIPF